MRKRNAIYNIFSSLILQVVMLLVNFIVPRLIIQHYGSAMNGLISSITQFLSYITLMESGVGSVVIAKYYKAFADNDNLLLSRIFKESGIFFRGIAYVALVYVAGMCGLYPLLVKSGIPNTTQILLIIIISATIFTQYLFGLTNQLVIHSDQKLHIINATKIGANIVSTALMAILIINNCNIVIVKLVSAVALISIPVVFGIYVKKHYSIDYKVSRDKSVLQDKWSGLGQHIAAFIHGNTDIVLLTLFAGVLEVSVYSVYAMVLQGLRSFTSLLSNGVSAAFGNLLASGEKEKAKRNYIAFDYLNMIVMFVVFSIAYFMIIPFVRLYSSVDTDVNYIRPTFAAIILLAECIYCVRCSYTCIIYAAGHFKQTMRNCFVEAIINIIISLLLVGKYGIIGVGIGTLVAMIYRSTDYIFYLSKHIVHWDIKGVIYRYLINFVAFGVVYVSLQWVPFDSINTVWQWIMYAVIVAIITATEYLVINTLLNLKGVKNIVNIYVMPLLNKVVGKIKG